MRMRATIPLTLLAVVSLPALAGKAASLPKAHPLQQQLQEHAAEVKKLQDAVTRQESKSRQAGQQLEQRDHAIAELQRQLDALRRGPATVSEHH